MILTCPNCGTQYVVKDGTIPPEGRQVRCAACKHSWLQDGPAAEPQAVVEPTPPPEPESAAEAAPTQAAPAAEPQEEGAEESAAGATMIEPRSGPEIEQRQYEEAVIDGQTDLPDTSASSSTATSAPAPLEPEPSSTETANVQSAAHAADWSEPPTAEPVDDLYSPFPADETEPRRGSFLAILLVVALIVAAAVVFWFAAPMALKAKLGITEAGPPPLQSVVTHMDRMPLESGNELLTVTGRVINPSAEEQEVPPIQAQLKSRTGKVVYSWTIQPPAHSLAPGASASFNSAEVNVPPGGEQLTLTFGEASSG